MMLWTFLHNKYGKLPLLLATDETHYFIDLALGHMSLADSNLDIVCILLSSNVFIYLQMSRIARLHAPNRN